MGGEKGKTWETGSCSHQRPILQSQRSSAHHQPLPPLSPSVAFSLQPKHFFSSPFCPSSIFHLDIPDLCLCILRPFLCPAKGLAASEERRAKPEPQSIRHPFALSSGYPPPFSLSIPSLFHSLPLLLSSPRLAAARIVALLHALRWRAHTVGLLQLSWARWRAAERADSSQREQRGGRWPSRSLSSLKNTTSLKDGELDCLRTRWDIQHGRYFLL